MSHLKILDTRSVTWNMFHTGDAQILGATAQNLIFIVTWDIGFVHPCKGTCNI